jgi:lipopolysaccharide transport system ATP-binding protein
MSEQTFPDNNEMLNLQSVSKKFCRGLRRSLLYGSADIAKTFLGIRYNTAKLRPKEFWALQDISFQMKPGEALGVIGGNGAGKSTLLRLISGIFSPDKGRIAVRGRVGTLIALGAGFHPYLSGRENILLNGAVLGMSRDEIASRTDEIIDFAGIGEFIDAPVSTYSSGMRVRLGFSIAINSSPDILIIDEVLAVGDLDFMKKSYARMENLVKNDGVTAVVVSHNMATIQRLCARTLVLDKGKSVFLGDTSTAISCYYERVLGKPLDEDDTTNAKLIHHKECSLDIKVEDFQIMGENGLPADQLISGKPAEFVVEIKNKLPKAAAMPTINILILNVHLTDLYVLLELPISASKEKKIFDKRANISCKVPYLGLAPGLYKIIVKIGDKKDGVYDSVIVARELKVSWPKDASDARLSLHDDFKFVMPAQWKFLDYE